MSRLLLPVATRRATSASRGDSKRGVGASRCSRVTHGDIPSDRAAGEHLRGQLPRRVEIALSREQFSAFGIGLNGERGRADAPADRRCFGELGNSVRPELQGSSAFAQVQRHRAEVTRSPGSARDVVAAVVIQPFPEVTRILSLRRRLPRAAHPWLVPTGRSMAGWSIAGAARSAGTAHAQAQSRRCRPARTPAQVGRTARR